MSRERQVRQNVLQVGRQALDRQIGLRLDRGRGSGNAVVLDGIIRGPRAVRLAHPGAVELGDAISVPQRLEVRKSARIFFLKSLAMERIFTYSDYRPETEGPHSVSK